MLPLTLLIGFAGAGLLLRRCVAARFEREVDARLPVGPAGVIPGAEAIGREPTGGVRRRAVLLLHGFGDTPQTLRYLADHLCAAGYAVRVPLLPAHGRTLREFRTARAEEWVAAARREYVSLLERYGDVAIVGLSMGGALSVILAAETPTVPALVLVAPYLSMPRRIRHAARVAWLWGLAVPYLRGGAADRSIHDPAERAKSLAYGALGATSLRALLCVVRLAWDALPRVSAPTLVIHSRRDHRVPVDAAERNFARLGAAEKRLAWTERGGHVLTVDEGREQVFDLVSRWLEAHPAPAGVLQSAQQLERRPARAG